MLRCVCGKLRATALVSLHCHLVDRACLLVFTSATSQTHHIWKLLKITVRHVRILLFTHTVYGVTCPLSLWSMRSWFSIDAYSENLPSSVLSLLRDQEYVQACALHNHSVGVVRSMLSKKLINKKVKQI